MGGWNQVDPSVAPAGGATEATQLLVEAHLDAIETILTGVVLSHITVSASGAGSVAAGAKRGSMLNVGSAAGTWNGISVPAGVGIPFGNGGEDDEYGVISYDATGTTFIIESTTG